MCIHVCMYLYDLKFMYTCMYVGATIGGGLGEGFLKQPEVQTKTE